MKTIDPFSIHFELALVTDHNRGKLKPYALGAVCLMLGVELVLAVLFVLRESTVPTFNALTAPLIFFNLWVLWWLANKRETPEHLRSVAPT